MLTSATLPRHVFAPASAVAGAADDVVSGVTEAEFDELLRSAVGYAERVLVPLNRDGDRTGSRLVAGRVKTPGSHKMAWRAYCDAGWLLLDADPAHGGLGMPTGVASAVQEIFDQACPAFGMMPVPIRAASRLLRAYGSPELQAEWLPHLAAGEWSATICISEPEAGSDVRRIRTRAELGRDGDWTISGEKCWISFGDQDISDRIGHCLLAKSAPDEISLFLVPDRFGGERNHIYVRRLEDKLGLHLSPTCALGFEGAHGFLLGERGRGLSQLFVMIRHMRLATAVQGAGIAARAYTTAKAYASERRQGGRDAQPVPIDTHADIQRLLLSMGGRLETLRALIQICAVHIDHADRAECADQRAHSAALTAWLLPIVKTLGGDVAFNVASDAIQILGGAGYTREWPVEQALRDARVLTIFEGTTGMQAQDLRFRQLGNSGSAPYFAFIAEARAVAASCPILTSALTQFEAAVAILTKADRSQRSNEWGATAFLNLATSLAVGWAAGRLSQTTGDGAVPRNLRAVAQWQLDELRHQLPSLIAIATASAPPAHLFDDLI